VAVLYDLVVVAHVLTVLGALVSLAVAGGYSAALLGGRRPAVDRYFRGGPSWGPRLLVPAAILGLIAAGLSGGRVRLDSGWVLGAGGLWLVAMASVEALLRPAEAALAVPEAGKPSRRPALRALAGAFAAVAAVVAASVVMTVQ
jgi:hypothetical protein